MSMAWTVLSGSDLRKVINAISQDTTNENLADTVKDGDELVMTDANRRDECVVQAVKLVRGAISACGRTISATANSVPPEGEWHTLVIAAYRLVSSTPGLVKFLVAGEGDTSPLAKMYGEAMRWVYGDPSKPRSCPGLIAGQAYTVPIDPIGADGATAVSDDNPVFEAVRVGEYGSETSDLSSYGPVTDDE
jgi:hypothetical protein